MCYTKTWIELNAQVLLFFHRISQYIISLPHRQVVIFFSSISHFISWQKYKIDIIFIGFSSIVHELQMIKMMVTIVIVFTICWLPFNVLVVSWFPSLLNEAIVYADFSFTRVKINHEKLFSMAFLLQIQTSMKRNQIIWFSSYGIAWRK